MKRAPCNMQRFYDFIFYIWWVFCLHSGVTSDPMLSTAAGWPGNLKQILTKYEHKGFIKAPHSCFVRHPTDKAAHIIGDIKSDVYEAASNLSNNVRSQSTFNIDWTSKGSK